MKKNISMVIPFRKFLLWSFLSLGTYFIIYIYRVFRYLHKNKKEYIEEKTGKFSPLLKTFFWIFYIFGLFDVSGDLSNSSKKSTDSSFNLSKPFYFKHAPVFILISYFSLQILDKLDKIYPAFDPSVELSVVLILISLSLNFFMAYLFKPLVENLNVYFSSEELGSNLEVSKRRLHWWEYLLLARGIVAIIISLGAIVLLLGALFVI